MSSSQLAHALLRLYPRAWRARYEDEVRALMEDAPPDLSALFDLARGVARERAFAAVRWRPTESMRLAAAGMVDMISLLGVGAVLALLAVLVAGAAGAHGVTSGPNWLAILVVFPFAAPLRWMLASTALTNDRWQWALVSTWELPLWCLVFFVTCVGSFLPARYDDGLSVSGNPPAAVDGRAPRNAAAAVRARNPPPVRPESTGQGAARGGTRGAAQRTAEPAFGPGLAMIRAR